MTQEEKKIDRTNFPALVKGGQGARETLALILRRERRNKENKESRLAENIAACF